MRHFHKAFAVFFAVFMIFGLWLLTLLDISALRAQDDASGTSDRVPIAEQFSLPLTSDATYNIQPRDTLDQIAAAFDIQLDCLRESNELSIGDILRVDQALTIRVDCPAYDGTLVVVDPRSDAPGRDGLDGTYAVRPSDTLDTIGQRLNISVESLKAANDIEYGRELRAGDVLVIPENALPYGQAPLSEVAAANTTPLEERARRAGDGATNYVVEAGDTLDTIGQELDVSVIELLQVNDLRRGRDLRIGFILVIPRDAAPYGQYPALANEVNADLMDRMARGELSGSTVVVQVNDTLDEIAQTNNISLEALRVANGIDSAKDLRPGRLLIIPEGVPVYGVTASLDQPAGGRIADGDIYVLQPGDTLDQIAAGFNVDTLCLLERNEITAPKTVLAGQLIGIPSDCTPYSGFDLVPDERPMTLEEMTSGSRSTDDELTATEEMTATEEPTN